MHLDIVGDAETWNQATDLDCSLFQGPYNLQPLGGFTQGQNELKLGCGAFQHSRQPAQVILNELDGLSGASIALEPANPSYEPLTRGMAAALPLVDVFAAAHNLAALRSLAGKLSL